AFNVVSLSTVSGGGTGPALLVQAAAGTVVADSYVIGSTAAYVSASTGTVIAGSRLTATALGGAGVQAAAGAGLSISSCVIAGGALGAAVSFDKGNTGLLSLSTSILSGSPYGLFVATQGAGAQ